MSSAETVTMPVVYTWKPIFTYHEGGAPVEHEISVVESTTSHWEQTVQQSSSLSTKVHLGFKQSISYQGAQVTSTGVAEQIYDREASDTIDTSIAQSKDVHYSKEVRTTVRVPSGDDHTVFGVFQLHFSAGGVTRDSSVTFAGMEAHLPSLSDGSATLTFTMDRSWMMPVFSKLASIIPKEDNKKEWQAIRETISNVYGDTPEEILKATLKIFADTTPKHENKSEWQYLAAQASTLSSSDADSFDPDISGLRFFQALASVAPKHSNKHEWADIRSTVKEALKNI